MHIPFFDLKRQYEFIKDEIDNKVIEIISSGNYISGPQVAAFEGSVKAYLGVVIWTKL